MTQLAYERPLFYRHSGKTPVVRLLVALATILPAAAVVGAVYAVIASYIPMLRFAKLILILAASLMAGFGFGVGTLTGRMLMWARVRNLAMILLVAALAAVVAWYVSWVVWEWHLFTQSDAQIPRLAFLLNLLIRPRGVWFLANAINKVGTFGMSDDMIKGPFLWVLWFVEAATVLGVATVVPYRMVRGRAFCERCQQWGRIRQGILSVGPAPDEDRLRARLSLKDLSALEELGQADMRAPRRLRVDLQNCPACDDMHLLSVHRIDVTYPKGQKTQKIRPLIERLWLDPGQAKTVLEIRERVYAGPSASAPDRSAPSDVPGIPAEAAAESFDDAGATAPDVVDSQPPHPAPRVGL